MSNNLKGQTLRKLKSEWRKVVNSRHGSDYELASLLLAMNESDKVDDFIFFCMDETDGLGVAQQTAYMYARMAEVRSSIQSRRLWEKVGWDGVRTVWNRTREKDEIMGICADVLKTKKNISAGRLGLIIDRHAKAKKPKNGGGSGPTKEELKKRNKALTDQNKQLRYALYRLITLEPSLRRTLASEVPGVIEVLGLEKQKKRKVRQPA